jgi:hypothetical protein
MALNRLDDEVIGQIADDILARGLDDLISLSEVMSRVQANGALHGVELSDAEKADSSVEVIRQVIDAGLMVVGSWVKGSPGFVPWDLDVKASVERIKREWRGLGSDSPEIGDLWFLWLSNTPAGNERGLSVRDEVNRRFDWPPG